MLNLSIILYYINVKSPEKRTNSVCTSPSKDTERTFAGRRLQFSLPTRDNKKKTHRENYKDVLNIPPSGFTQESFYEKQLTTVLSFYLDKPVVCCASGPQPGPSIAFPWRVAALLEGWRSTMSRGGKGKVLTVVQYSFVGREGG